MVKKSSKDPLLVSGELLSCKGDLRSVQKRRGRSRYLLSVPIEIWVESRRMRLFRPSWYLSGNRSNRKDYLALISTDTTLTEDEIIQLYGKRWDIEVFFKTSKSSCLRLTGECRPFLRCNVRPVRHCVCPIYVPWRIWYPGEPGSSFCRSIVLPGSRRIGGHIVCGGFGEIATFPEELLQGFHHLQQGICALIVEFLADLPADVVKFLDLDGLKADFDAKTGYEV